MAAFADTGIQRAFKTFADPPEFELYDLRADPIEFENLAGKSEFKAIEDRLKRVLQAYRRRTDDPFLDQEMMNKMMDLVRTFVLSAGERCCGGRPAAQTGSASPTVAFT